MTKSILLTIIIVTSLLCACSRNAAQVGSIAITDQDIDLRAKVSEIYYPESGKRYVGLAQLIKGYLSIEILKALGRTIDQSMLDAESKRIDENTKAPETLNKIKNIYGPDQKAYIRTFVRVTYAERTLYGEVFLKSKEIHQKQFQQAQALLGEAIRAAGSFKKIAERSGALWTKLLLSKEKGLRPFVEENRIQVSQGFISADDLMELVSALRPGTVCPRIIERPETYLVIRLLGKKGDNFVVETATVPKRSFDEWFWEQASKIPVKINDPVLKAELLKEVSWAKNLRLE